MKKRKPKPWKEESEKLMNFLCENDLEKEVHQFSPYHFRIKERLDVWPGSKKYYVRGTSGSQSYGSVQEIGEILKSLEVKIIQ